MAAASLGLKTHVFTPEADSPASEVAGAVTVADYRDEAALARFAGTVAVVTYEFENVPAATAAVLARHAPVRPNERALETAQDRLVEKQFLRGLGLETAPFVPVDDPGALARAVAQLGRPSILKTRRFGYDGKGQALVREGSDLAVVFRSLGQKSILEGVVPFTREVSTIVARGLDGASRVYDLCENQHVGGILATTTLPATVRPETEQAAAALHGASPTRSTMSAYSRSKCSWCRSATAGPSGSSSTRSRPASTIRAIGRSAAPSRRSSSSTSGPSAAGRSAKRGAGARSRCATLIGDDVQSLATHPVRTRREPAPSTARPSPRPGRKMGHVTVVRRAA